MNIRHPAIRYHGGKFRLAARIISHFPVHRCYVEPFGGAASVLLKKDPSEAEVYNDLDGDVVNLFRVLRDPTTSQALITACALTPYSREEFILAYQHSDDPTERARRLVVRATMGFGSAGATKGKTGFRLDTKRNCATAQRIWARYPDNLAAVASRFAGGVDVGKNRTYRFEMSGEEHMQLLSELKTLQGAVIVCGYNSELYNDSLPGWLRVTHTTAANGRAGSVQRTECLWIKPVAQQKQENAA
ncbi:TPA: DNA adenine methylase [Salmonella enterica subsp. enterica serovar Muenchen]|nr:DNA adenine methylase [Salmonella enterica subsp. enterica serovar Muenchen]EGL1840070.1 DNA adenine methylase [Salmonella enterica]EGV6906915.1 DNA adenine methylase [Salmonella enterica]ELN6264389.1 DNA adenine methylase [Salmonella enterica]